MAAGRKKARVLPHPLPPPPLGTRLGTQSYALPLGLGRFCTAVLPYYTQAGRRGCRFLIGHSSEH
jgi:hypothetical protein